MDEKESENQFQPDEQKVYCGAQGMAKEAQSDLVIRLRARRDRLRAESAYITRSLDRLTEAPTKMSMNELVLLIESTNRPIEIQ